MSEPRDERSELDPTLREELRRRARPAAPPAVRERARAAFLDGGGRRRAGNRRWILAGALPLAAAVIFSVFLALDRPPDAWQVVSGAPVRGERGTLSLPAGQEAQLRLGSSLRLQLLPGSEVVLPAPPGRWTGRTRTLVLIRGEIRATSGTRPLPFRLRVATEEAVVSLAGTTFAVIRDDEATCVCLYQGAIHVLARGEASPTPVAVRTRRYIYRDGRPSAEEPLSDMECMKLEMLLQAGP